MSKIIYTGIESSGKSLRMAIEIPKVVKRNAEWYKETGIVRPIYSNLKFTIDFEKWAKEHIFMCHFTIMEIDEGLYGETIFVCKHCGHTVDADGFKIDV